MRILIARFGAYGDVIITTPLVRHLAKDHEIVYMTSDRGMEILRHNPRIKKLILHPKDSVPIDKLGEHIKKVAKQNGCERIIDLCESIEVALSLHPRGAEYNTPKEERRELYERNFYEYTFEFAGEEWNYDKSLDDPIPNLNPELFFSDTELADAKKLVKPGAFNILVGMSGSGTNKAWPWTAALCNTLMMELPNVHLITVGDERCQLLEQDILDMDRVTKQSGKLPMRISMALTGLVDCVVSPDTGLLHASGCYETPKVGIIGHNTREVVTKHFANDYSVEADPIEAECAPCFRLIYNMEMQCPTANPELGGGAWCMTYGIKPETVYAKIKEIHAKSQQGS